MRSIRSAPAIWSAAADACCNCSSSCRTCAPSIALRAASVPTSVSAGSTGDGAAASRSRMTSSIGTTSLIAFSALFTRIARSGPGVCCVSRFPSISALLSRVRRVMPALNVVTFTRSFDGSNRCTFSVACAGWPSGPGGSASGIFSTSGGSPGSGVGRSFPGSCTNGTPMIAPWSGSPGVSLPTITTRPRRPAVRRTMSMYVSAQAVSMISCAFATQRIRLFAAIRSVASRPIALRQPPRSSRDAWSAPPPTAPMVERTCSNTAMFDSRFGSARLYTGARMSRGGTFGSGFRSHWFTIRMSAGCAMFSHWSR